MGKWAAKKGGLKKAPYAVSDFAPGHDAEAGFTKGFTDAGGKIVDTVQFAVKDPDFIPSMQRIKDAKPDAVFVFVPSGKQATAVMKAYNDLNMKADGVKIIGPQDIVPDEELPSMGQEPFGVISAGTYSNAGNRPANKAYRRRVEARIRRQDATRFHVGRRLGQHGRDLLGHQGDQRQRRLATRR